MENPIRVVTAAIFTSKYIEKNLFKESIDASNQQIHTLGLGDGGHWQHLCHAGGLGCRAARSRFLRRLSWR
ncbi:MAG: hypothetical protein AB7S55_08895 [Thiomonas sp.]|jgi:hypothetical protein